MGALYEQISWLVGGRGPWAGSCVSNTDGFGFHSEQGPCGSLFLSGAFIETGSISDLDLSFPTVRGGSDPAFWLEPHL